MNILGIHRWNSKLAKYIEIQLFIWLFSLPVLIGWGLPLSLLSPVGNLIFTPFLMGFLLLSSLAFFAELFYLPNLWLLHLLERLTTIWAHVLKMGRSSWLIGFSTPSLLLLIPPIIGGIIVLHHKNIPTSWQKNLYLSIILGVTMGSLSLLNTNKSSIEVLDCNNGALTLIRTNNKTVLIDPGYLGQRASSLSWIEYTLVPFLFKTFGTSTIDQVIFLQPSKLTLEVLQKLCQITPIHHIYFPGWKGVAEKSFLWRYGALKRTLTAQSIPFTRFGLHPQRITLSTTSFLELNPLEEELSYSKLTFKAVAVVCMVNDEQWEIYPVKSKKKPQ